MRVFYKHDNKTLKEIHVDYKRPTFIPSCKDNVMINDSMYSVLEVIYDFDYTEKIFGQPQNMLAVYVNLKKSWTSKGTTE